MLIKAILTFLNPFSRCTSNSPLSILCLVGFRDHHSLTFCSIILPTMPTIFLCFPTALHLPPFPFVLRPSLRLFLFCARPYAVYVSAPALTPEPNFFSFAIQSPPGSRLVPVPCQPRCRLRIPLIFILLHTVAMHHFVTFSPPCNRLGIDYALSAIHITDTRSKA